MAHFIDNLETVKILLLAQAAGEIAERPSEDLGLPQLVNHYIHLSDAAANLDDLGLIHSFAPAEETEKEDFTAKVKNLATVLEALKTDIVDKFRIPSERVNLSAEQLSFCNRLQRQNTAAQKTTTPAAAYISDCKQASRDWLAFLKSLKIDLGNGEIALTASAKFLQDPDRSVRQNTYHLLSPYLKDRRTEFTTLLNRICKANNSAAESAGFADPLSMRVIEADLQGDTVRAYMHAVVQSFPQTTHPFYKEKAAILGLPELEVYDTTATETVAAPFAPTATDAAQLWLASLAKISPELCDLGKQAMADGRMKIGDHPRSQTLAFSVWDGPVAFVSFKPTIDGIRAVGHEGGHLLHLLLARAYAHQGNYRPDNLVAETIALFFEGAILDTLAEQRPDLVPAITAGRKQRDITAICATTSFMEFEIAAHDLARKGPLDAETIENLWKEKQAQRFGATVISRPENHGLGWALIPQIMLEPFCSYSYGMGQTAAHAFTSIINRDPTEVQGIVAIMRDGAGTTYENIVQEFAGSTGSLQQFFVAGVDNLASQYAQAPRPDGGIGTTARINQHHGHER